MSKPTPERNAGADAAFRLVFRALNKRRKLYEASKLLDEAYVLTDIGNIIREGRHRASKRRGGIGRK